MKYTFTPLMEGEKEFTILCDERGRLDAAQGISIVTAARHMSKGQGIDGLQRAKRYTHSMTVAKPDGEYKREDVELEGDIAKTDSERQIVFGWAYTAIDKNGAVIDDHSGEFVDDPLELEDMAYSFVIKGRRGGVDHKNNDDGTPFQASTLIESMVFTTEKIQAMEKSLDLPAGTLGQHLPRGAWWVGFKVEDQASWASVKSGKHTSFSIRGKALRKEI